MPSEDYRGIIRPEPSPLRVDEETTRALVAALGDLVKSHEALRRRSGYGAGDESDSLDDARAALRMARRED